MKSITIFRVFFSRTYTNGDYTRTWKNQTHDCFWKSEAENLVSEWNRINAVNLKANPENGSWFYAQDKIETIHAEVPEWFDSVGG